MESSAVYAEQKNGRAGTKSDVVLTNAMVVTRSDCFAGTLKVVDGVIVDVSRGVSKAPDAIDLGGDYLLPGLIDVHTDHLEKHIMPRPGMLWNSVGAAIAHDVQVCAAGITTVFDSLIVGSVGNPERRRLLPLMLEGLDEARRHRLLRADHLLHLRCDNREPDLVDLFGFHADRPDLRFVTIMDDGPTRDIERFRRLERRKNTPEADIEAQIAAAPSGEQLATDNRRRIIELCRERQLRFASHDDTMKWHVDEAVALGATISEFPITMEAATAAREAGMTTIVGSPNLVAGRSHIGNVSARELAAHGLIDVLCSDYIPGSILRAVWHLAAGLRGPSLAEAVSLATLRPAQTFGLADRGEISTGKRADLIRVAERSGPVVRQVWVRGERVL